MNLQEIKTINAKPQARNSPSLFLFKALSAFLFFSIGCNNDEMGKSENRIVIHDTDKRVPDTIETSILAVASKYLNGTEIVINYASPRVRNRLIWGGLVPYNQVWVTGAHQATSIYVSRDFVAGGKEIPAGKYALFTIPNESEWIIIINRNWNQHLADEYNASEDLVRIKVIPQMNKFQERLKYEVDQIGEKWANIIISWEKLRVKFDIRIKP